MQARGIDPQQFFAEIGPQLQSGAMDFNDLQQLLISRGLLDRQTVNQMQNSVQKFALNSIRQQLNMTDEEWTAVLPKVQRLVTAAGNVNQGAGPGGGRGGFGGAAGFMRGGGSSDVMKAVRDLRVAVQDPNTTADQFALKIIALRDARQRAQTELNSAQRDLTGVLTIRQEAALSNMGLLD
jgi:hypothetical protein